MAAHKKSPDSSPGLLEQRIDTTLRVVSILIACTSSVRHCYELDKAFAAIGRARFDHTVASHGYVKILTLTH